MTSRVRVVHLITDLARGGAEIFLQRLVASRTSADISHYVISLTTEGDLAREIRAAGVETRALSLAGVVGAPLTLFRLVRTLRAIKPDVLMTWLYHADFFGTLAASLVPGLSLVWNVRCADMDMMKYGFTSRALPRALARLSRRPDVIVANSEAGRAFHAAYGYRSAGWQVLPNGFDTEAFRPDGERREKVRAKLGVAPGTPLIGLFARFDPMKDHVTFLAAAGAVVETHPQALFLLAGRGTNGPEFDRLVGDRPLLRQRLLRLGERTDVQGLMAATDVVVCSSLSEGFPNTLGEAMACGVPCVTTAVGDAAWLIGDTGQVVGKGDWRALAQHLRKLVDLAPERRAELGMAGRLRIEAEFSMQAVTARYTELFISLAGKRRH